MLYRCTDCAGLFPSLSDGFCPDCLKSSQCVDCGDLSMNLKRGLCEYCTYARDLSDDSDCEAIEHSNSRT